MMKIYLFIFLFLNFAVDGQTFSAEYNFSVTNKDLGKTFVFPAILKFNVKSNIKFYKVQFGIENDEVTQETYFASKKKPVYLIYSKPHSKTLIFENIPNVKEKDYVLEDDYDMIWTLVPETKTINNKKLLKAETDFRGRHYIAWYDENAKVPVGPWKFKNTPGLIYEVHDDQNNFTWSLITFKKSSEEIKNPFQTYTGEILSYHKYPELRYGLSDEMKKQLEKFPGNTIAEQERNGLEIKFEWVK